MNMIADLWRYACLAKSEPKTEKTNTLLCDSNVFIPMSNDTDYGYIAEFEDRVIISFRGTRGELKPWIENFDPYPLQCDLEKNMYLSTILKQGSWGKGIIHDGFYNAWLFFKPVIDDYLKQMPTYKKIRITGHSRGGALCTLCSRHLAKNRGLRSTCISFGAPAQGVFEYAKELNSLSFQHIRVTHGYDIVPSLPPESLGFMHGGLHNWLPEPKIHKWFNKIRDHFYSSYTTGLIQYCIRQGDAVGESLMRLMLTKQKQNKE